MNGKPNLIVIAGVALASFFIFFVLGYLGSTRGGLGGALLMIVFVIAIIGGLVAMFLSKTKSVPIADDAARQRALAAPAADEARLIVVREGFVGKLQGLDVLIDGTPATQLKSPRFAALSLAPGNHVVEARGVGMKDGTATCQVTLTPGATALVRVAMGIGALNVTLEPFDDAARRHLATIPMVVA